MSWHCPACHEPIRHSEFETKPRRGQRYRCHICRLELSLDPSTDRLTVTPLEPVEPETNGRPSRKDS